MLKARQIRRWSNSALASPPHHHRRFIKEQGKEKQWCYMAAYPVKRGAAVVQAGDEVVVVRWRCEYHGRRILKKNVV
ncbi:unnamed protein product [Eruca vesicaria subsp. sativa]|uniref:Uncharacterized protein n=1 Tax=Eruca vesicaria subsp. sativa TaxID=29727 RepID=A0ABC8JNC1_ERUVS|nr:unnamed protein product [Eruca vesicaria subsp. sativa]